MAKLSCPVILSQFKKGDNAPCYSARVKHNGTVSSDDFIKRLAISPPSLLTELRRDKGCFGSVGDLERRQNLFSLSPRLQISQQRKQLYHVVPDHATNPPTLPTSTTSLLPRSFPFVICGHRLFIHPSSWGVSPIH